MDFEQTDRSFKSVILSLGSAESPHQILISIFGQIRMTELSIFTTASCFHLFINYFKVCHLTSLRAKISERARYNWA